MQTNRMYDELAYLWPLISAPEEYAEEAVHWKRVLRNHLSEGRHQILELGVGGGNNLSHLTDEFDAVAVDLSPGMLEHSKRINPGVEHHTGDMRTVRLERKFDAVIIHDAISYMLSEDDLRSVFRTAIAHLKPDGIFVTSPDWYKETFPGEQLTHSHNFREGIDLRVVYYEYDPDPADTTINMACTYIIQQNGHVQVESDLHTLGLFSRNEWLQLMQDEGFHTDSVAYPVHEDGREAYLLTGVLSR